MSKAAAFTVFVALGLSPGCGGQRATSASAASEEAAERFHFSSATPSETELAQFDSLDQEMASRFGAFGTLDEPTEAVASAGEVRERGPSEVTPSYGGDAELADGDDEEPDEAEEADSAAAFPPSPVAPSAEASREEPRQSRATESSGGSEEQLCQTACGLAQAICELRDEICRVAAINSDEQTLVQRCSRSDGRCGRARDVARSRCGC